MLAVFAARFSTLPAVAAFAMFAGCAEARAEAAALGGDFPRPQLEVTASTLPRFDGADALTQTTRVDMRLLAPGRSGLGLAVGLNSASGGGGAFPTLTPARSIDLGVHWRYTFDSNHRFDVTAYRKVPNGDAISLIESRDPTYGARVEMGFGSRSVRKGFVADRGFVGLQLEGGARVSVKRKNGGPMFYYRNTF